MHVPIFTRSRRIRETPFSRRVDAAGVASYTCYNHMLLATGFGDTEGEYHHLKSAVQVWDVSVERQVEVRGKDAGRLVQMLTPRDLRALSEGRCFYTPMVDETGGMLNDPVTLKLAEDRYWISIADSDLMFWIKGIARGLAFEVDVTEPEIAPLAVQGPLAEELMTRVFGEDVRRIRFFRYSWLEFAGKYLVVARSGYSKQGGFEIYVEGDRRYAEALWDALFEAGRDLDVRPGCPNLIERIEGRLLSYGADMTRRNTPHECGLAKFCDTKIALGCIGRDALLRVAADGPMRQIRSLSIDGPPLRPCTSDWSIVDGEQRVGRVTSCAWSPDFQTNVAIGMLRLTHWDDGTRVSVKTPEGRRWATVRVESFI
ncbi:MAG: dimethylsulfoniopropionate demethylase [Pseudomonadota bacterium]